MKSFPGFYLFCFGMKGRRVDEQFLVDDGDEWGDPAAVRSSFYECF